MQDEILEQEIRKKTMVMLENMDELFKSQIETLCEAWSYRHSIYYFLWLLDYVKTKNENKKAPQ